MEHKIWTREEVENLAVGDIVENVFNKPMKITRIHARGISIYDKAYACFYQEFGPGSHMSNSVGEGEAIVTLLTGSNGKRPI